MVGIGSEVNVSVFTNDQAFEKFIPQNIGHGVGICHGFISEYAAIHEFARESYAGFEVFVDLM